MIMAQWRTLLDVLENDFQFRHRRDGTSSTSSGAGTSDRLSATWLLSGGSIHLVSVTATSTTVEIRVLGIRGT